MRCRITDRNSSAKPPLPAKVSPSLPLAVMADRHHDLTRWIAELQWLEWNERDLATARKLAARQPDMRAHSDTYRLSSVPPVEGTGKRHRFMSRVDFIKDRDGVSKTEAMLTSSYSITSVARSRIDGGIARPSAVAALRFTTISYFVGNCTGRSPGFSPRRMRST